MSERDFWLMIRRALLMICKTKATGQDLRIVINKALLMICDAIEEMHAIKSVDKA